ncbi:MAG TPA: hypothetical protein DCE23_07475 [Firmicutes bacterium]|nr:hypothetical protein [Bacillota bacterium]
MARKFKFGRRFAAGLIALSIVGSGLGAMKLYKVSQINRVKGYLEDFLNEDNYVDLSKITSMYDISDFKGEYLYEALRISDIRFVRIADTYIYDGAHVETFEEKCAFNYDHVIGTTDSGEVVYEGYQPIIIPTDDGVTYSVPEGYELQDINVIAEPLRYDKLKDKEIKVVENEYEDSYSLYLTNGKNR